MRPKVFVAFSFLAITLWSTGCNKIGFGPTPDKTPTWKEHDDKLKNYDSQLKEISAEIVALQGKVECESAAQCRVVGLGSKVCGHFKDYLVYSVKDVNGKSEEALLVKVKHFNTVFSQMIEQMINVPPCGRAVAPIACIKGRCAPKN